MTKRSSYPNQPKAEVEVQLNSRIFCVWGVDAAAPACTIAAHAGRPPDARQDSVGGPRSRAFADPADGRPEARERDPHPPRRLKRDLKAGRAQIHGLLLDPPDYLLTAKVFDLLLAVPKYGRVKVNRILTHCRISPSKTIGGLSERQRNELVSFLRR